MGDRERDRASYERKGDGTQNQEGIFDRIEGAVQQKQNDHQTDRHHRRHSFLLRSELIVLTGPFHAIPIGKAHLLGQASLGLFHGTLEVTIPHAELDRNIAFVVFAIDNERTGLRRNRGHLLQGNARPIRSADQDITDRVDILSKLREKPDDKIEQPFPFIHLGHGLTPNGGLHHRINIRHLQPIARARLTIDLDQQIRLPHEAEDPQILYAFDLLHDTLDLAGLYLHGFQIGPE